MPGGVTGSDTLTCSSGRAPGKERQRGSQERPSSALGGIGF